jgi:hypothetical protein
MFKHSQAISLMRDVDAQQNDAESRLLEAKNQLAKVFVAGHDHATFCRCYLEDTSIRRFWRKARCTENVVIRVF